MIRLSFVAKREIFVIEILGREIWYTDRMSGKRKIMPGGESEMTAEELDEYNNARTEEELAENCIKDAKKTGAMLLSRKVL